MSNKVCLERADYIRELSYFVMVRIYGINDYFGGLLIRLQSERAYEHNADAPFLKALEKIMKWRDLPSRYADSSSDPYFSQIQGAFSGITRSKQRELVDELTTMIEKAAKVLNEMNKVETWNE